MPAVEHASARRELYGICAPGLEALAAAELVSFGVTPSLVEPGGVAFQGGDRELYTANLRSRLLSRVVVRIGEFHARALGELERRAARLPWERTLVPGVPVRLRVTCRQSRLYHTGAVAERVTAALASHGGAGEVSAARRDDEDASEGQLIIVRVAHDRCTVSADASGALLHRRGYRLASARAPLRETLAAGMLMACGWTPDLPLLDPLCGSGTIAIEAALIARGMAPGLARSFAFERWPDFDAAVWAGIRSEARERAAHRAPAPIQASDRDAGAVDAARANAERAGVAADVEITRRALSAIEPPAEPGWIVTNPPYGVRVGDAARLRDLYAQLGNVARRRWPGCALCWMSADRRLDGQVDPSARPVLRTRNGGLAVRVMVGRAR